jgi:micrococcal nuclease
MYEYRAKCVKVIDGDTYDFEVDLGFHTMHQIRVRLKGIDTPELNSKNAEEHAHAERATELATALLVGWVTIRTEKDKIGIYGRYTATVTLSDGVDLAKLLTERGMTKHAAYPT